MSDTVGRRSPPPRTHFLSQTQYRFYSPQTQRKTTEVCKYKSPDKLMAFFFGGVGGWGGRTPLVIFFQTSLRAPSETI